MSNNLINLIGERRAQKWASAFIEKIKDNPMAALDEATMLAWFACAIEAGYDCGVKDCRPESTATTQLIKIKQ